MENVRIFLRLALYFSFHSTPFICARSVSTFVVLWEIVNIHRHKYT